MTACQTRAAQRVHCVSNTIRRTEPACTMPFLRVELIWGCEGARWSCGWHRWESLLPALAGIVSAMSRPSHPLTTPVDLMSRC